MDGLLAPSSLAWFALIAAGLFEIGWPLGLKVAQTGPHRILGAFGAIVMMTISGVLLWLAQKTIPMGTAYAVWTGIGAAGTFALGIILYDEPLNLLRVAGALLIIFGVICLKAGH